MKKIIEKRIKEVVVISDEKKKSIRTIQEIMRELDKTGKYGIEDSDKLMEDAEKIRARELKEIKTKEEKNKPKIKTPKEIKEAEEEEFEKSIKEEETNPLKIWSEENSLKEFETYPFLRQIFFKTSVIQPTMVSMIRKELGFTKEDEKTIRNQLKKLKRMGYVEEVLACEIFWKDYFNKKYGKKFELTKEEQKILRKMDYQKGIDERTKNMFIGQSGFWVLTDLGKKFFIIAKKSQKD